MSEDTEEKSQAGRWVIAMVSVLVVYVLSFGPVCALANKYYDSPEAAQFLMWTFYKPLEWGCERLGLEKLSSSYYAWWCEIFHAPY